MSLSRLSALVPSAVGRYLASTFSVRHHPTVVRYNAILAQAFYHHGRLCASNQATVMVLVILFVGMIAYPGLVTHYNSYILASYRHHPVNAASTSSHFGPGGAASLRRSDLESGNLDEFWSGIIEPTWSQDPSMFQKTLPPKPMHYLAPVIINATDTSLKYENGEGPGILSDAEVLVYAADVQRRLQSISVDLTEDMLISPPASSTSSSSGTLLDDLADQWETELVDETTEEEEEEEVDTNMHNEEGKLNVLESLHHPPADRGYTRIWTEEEQQLRHASRTGDLLLDVSQPSSIAVVASESNPNSLERGRNMANGDYFPEDHSGTSFGASTLNLHHTKQSVATPSPTPGNTSPEQSIPHPPSPTAPVRLFDCLIQSPVAYWQNDVERIRADKDILGTISSRQNSTHPLSQSTLFGGRVLNQHTNQIQGATSVIMTFFLQGNAAEMYPEEYQRIYGGVDSGMTDRMWRKDLDVVKVWTALFNAVMRELRQEREMAWLKAHPQHDQKNAQQQQPTPEGDTAQQLPDKVVADKGGESVEAHLPAPTPSVVMMKVSQDVELGHGGFKRLVSGDFAKPNTNISAEYWLLAMAYFVMFLYISLSVGRVDLVKSKYGLGIAAVATVFVSLVMSIGICSVFGVYLTLMPWEILPFMIIVVGVENINILVHAVVETSMDLPVKERVGRGLSAVGVSITMTLLAEICLLAVGAMTTIPAVQEFCTFAIAAVIMDYLLQMTFFITVISIDIRRLELTDLSATGHRLRGTSFKYPYGNRHHPHHPHHHHSHPHLLQYGPFSAAARGQTGESKAFGNDQAFMGRPRSGSNASTDADEGGKGFSKPAKKSPKGRIFTSILMVGLMTYLGHIYGRTNQTLEDEMAKKVQVSFWHIASSDVSSAFWALVDPENKGGYLEICPPVVLTMATPSYSANGSECVVPPQGTTAECDVTDGSDDDTGSDVLDDGTIRHREPSRQKPGHGSSEGKKLKGRRKGKKGKRLKDEDFNDGTLDPRRPFKMLKNGIIFFVFFAFWLLRVFVIPSMILAAAILVLLSYLLSPQRKLLVDLQWRFPFIVLPGDYQSKRQLMMEQLLAQEAHELGLDGSASSIAPLPGTVETFKRSGHVTDIEQMDVNPAGLILSSSMDKKILLWNGGGSSMADDGNEAEKRLPLARLLSATSTTTTTATIAPGSAATPYLFPRPGRESTKRIVRCLKLDPLGRFAAAGYTDGGVHLWAIDSVIATAASPLQQSHQQYSSGWVPELKASLELQRQHAQTDPQSSKSAQEAAGSSSRDRVTTLQFWNDLEETDNDDEENDEQQRDTRPLGSATASSSFTSSTPALSLFVGYRDGQVCEWCPQSGRLRTSIQTKHRGGVAELAIVRLTPKTRQSLGLSQQKTYMVTAGKDGSLQCWVRFAPPSLSPSSEAAVNTAAAATSGMSTVQHGQQQHTTTAQHHSSEAPDFWQWTRIWTIPGDGSGSSIVVLSVDKQVPMVASGTANGAIKVWDLEQGNLIWTLSRGVASAVPNATAAGMAGASSMSGPHRPSPHLQHSRKQSLGSAYENHQPSHQAMVTRIIFKPLELEDGITGEPAPRVWLIISSGMDEAVMIWMVEWEGLLSMASGSSSALPLSPSLPVHPHEMPSNVNGAGVGPSSTLTPPSSSQQPTPPPFLRTSQRSNSQANLHHHLGLLSTSLPAPRLVGYMKQRGGKSIAVRHSSIFGVRRKENAAAGGSGSGGSSNGNILSARKQSYASVLDAAGLSQPGTGHVNTASASSVLQSGSGGILRNRSKSDAGLPQGVATPAMGGSNNTSRRGWEPTPPVTASSAGSGSVPTNAATTNMNVGMGSSSSSGSTGLTTGATALTPSSSSSNLAALSTTGLGVGMPLVTANGSSAPVLVGYDPTGAMSPPTPTARLRRRPGSNTSSSLVGSNLSSSVPGAPTQGYIYSIADTMTAATPTTAATLSPGAQSPFISSTPDPWMNEPALMMMDQPEPDLLPFVETRHIFAVDYMPLTTTAAPALPTSLSDPFQTTPSSPLPPPPPPASSSSSLSSSKTLPPPPLPSQLRRWPSEQNVHTTSTSSQQQQPLQPSEVGGIIVGFGNWIKVVRLQDDEEDEGLDGEDPYGYDDGHLYHDGY
ncbi:hypothetical protein BGZ73_004767 [Actinomortierella ambigua]|nr:hypothetical protein BGZ73_004767 [Actinomortierella ambigua]